MYPTPRAGLAAAAMWLGFAAAGIAAPVQAAGAAPAAAAPAASGEATLIPANGRPIALEVGGGTLIRLPRAANTVFVANPDIADVQVKSPTLVYVSAKSPGETVIYAVDANDQVLLNAAIRVAFDLSQFRRSLNQLVPGNAISVSQIDANLVLSGAVASAGQAQKAATLAAAITGGVKSAKIVNRLTVATPNQVNLQVRFAEVDRNILKQIGVDWSKVGSSPAIGNAVSGPAASLLTTNNPTPLVNYLTVGMFPSLFGQQLSATIEALATEGFLTILADPNLTAMSGQTASFLAGGEFPVPIAQSSAAGAAPTITIEFKQFGVQLAFTPTIIDANHLNLRVRPEVSQLSTQGEVNIDGFVIPALTVRRADTTVELASGQSFALAGLLQHNTTQDLSKVPWLGDIPILGALFRSDKFEHDETELVIIVTPYLVQPTATALAAPTDGFAAPHDAQQVLWGDTWRQSLPGPARGPLGAGGSGLIGPAGFRLN
ncbi:MAG TPA: type II and III secretion system protein family protein [Stellaceae bacterium]|jgi:pilus assembly protein CpaC|nr:type II and III secretion system protein family protein [Stellaceae bacterium]